MKPTPFTLPALALLGALLLPASGQTAGVLGRIGDIEVKIDEVRSSLAGLGEREGEAVAKDPSLLNQVVRSLLVQRLLLKEAEAKGWDKRPEVIAQVERARQSALAESYLQSLATPPENFPNETELKAAYEANKAALLVPKSYRLAQIFIAAPKDAAKDVLDKAQAKLDLVRKGLKQANADFPQLATEHSEEQASAGRGGEIGWLAESQIQPEIRDAVASLSLNALTEPVRLADGWHVVKVLDIREAHTPTLVQVREQLVRELRAERTRALSQAQLAKLLQENPLAINELALSEVVAKEKADVAAKEKK